ncbi:unnamed protein product [Phytophthora fragariaefolia]|uniref:Unnamed protein product n=1 Tax=Phytophthora fragariaefolia TaxID=1490495 RepID=A0A9W6XU71_9STRA|nr:unnamed protein product [Phytophthora fragariaefolia]
MPTDASTMQFDGGYDVVHIDEKWFNEDKEDRADLLLDGEKPPPRDRKSKRFIPKTMFLAAVARPRFDHNTGAMFDGKIGLWPLTETFVAKRDRVHRKKVTVSTRNVAAVDRPLYKHYIIDHVIPVIKAK